MIDLRVPCWCPRLPGSVVEDDSFVAMGTGPSTSYLMVDHPDMPPVADACTPAPSWYAARPWIHYGLS